MMPIKIDWKPVSEITDKMAEIMNDKLFFVTHETDVSIARYDEKSREFIGIWDLHHEIDIHSDSTWIALEPTHFAPFEIELPSDN